MLRVAICDPGAERAQMLFKQCGPVIGRVGVRCELTCHRDGARILENLAGDSNYYDVYILNGQAPETVLLAARIREKTLTAALIFTLPQGSPEPLFRYRLSAVIADPANGSLEKVLARCCAEQLQCRAWFTVKNRDGFLRIPYEDIITVESHQRLCILKSSRQVVEFYAKLGQVEQQLPKERFLRCHQSYLVNMDWISRLDKANRLFILRGGQTVEISRSSYSQTVERYEAYIDRM